MSTWVNPPVGNATQQRQREEDEQLIQECEILPSDDSPHARRVREEAERTAQRMRSLTLFVPKPEWTIKQRQQMLNFDDQGLIDECVRLVNGGYTNRMIANHFYFPNERVFLARLQEYPSQACLYAIVRTRAAIAAEIHSECLSIALDRENPAQVSMLKWIAEHPLVAGDRDAGEDQKAMAATIMAIPQSAEAIQDRLLTARERQAVRRMRRARGEDE